MRYETSAVTLANGITLSCVTQGDRSGPALVLLPGPTDSWRSYEPVLAHLPLSIHVIAVSQRGHGDSDKPGSGYQVEDFAGDVVSLLDSLDIDRAVLAGHSGSCLVARRVAIDHPGRVAGLVLEASPTTLRANADLEAFVASIVATLTDPIDPAFARSVIVDTSSGQLAADLIDALAGDLEKVPAHVWQEMFAGLLAYDDTDELDGIAAPALLIWGDADALVGREMQAVLSARVRGAELVAYPGVGHTPRWEQPDRFAHDVAAFIARSIGSWRSSPR